MFREEEVVLWLKYSLFNIIDSTGMKGGIAGPLDTSGLSKATSQRTSVTRQIVSPWIHEPGWQLCVQQASPVSQAIAAFTSPLSCTSRRSSAIPSGRRMGTARKWIQSTANSQSRLLDQCPSLHCALQQHLGSLSSSHSGRGSHRHRLLSPRAAARLC